MYDGSVRDVTRTLTHGWNRLKPGPRHALLCGDGPSVLVGQADIGLQIERPAPRIPGENSRWSCAWIKRAEGGVSRAGALP